VPVGPEFRDVPKAGNAEPYLDPLQGAYPIGSSIPFNSPIQMGVFDPDINDTLTGRWVANYPPFTKGSSEIIPPDDVIGDRHTTNHEATFMILVTCPDFMKAADQSLTFIVSDNGFSAPDFSKVYPYNYDSDGNPAFLMASWRVTGCP
jgi:hypothetical protein